MSKLNNKEVIVCNKCHGMNFYSQYSWFCPFCNRKVKRKNFLSSNKGNTNFFAQNNIEYDKNVFNFDNEKSDNNYKNNNKNINIYNNHFLRNTIAGKINNIKQEIKQYNSQENKEKSNLSHENNVSFSKRNTIFSIKHLFLKNDNKEKYDKTVNSLSFNEKNKNNNSLGKSLKRKTTLYEILQKRNEKSFLSSSRDKKKSLYNNISANNFNIKINLDHSLKKDNSNPKEIIFKRFSFIEKNLRKNIDNKFNTYKSEQEKKKYIRESDSNGTKRNIRDENYNKNFSSKDKENVEDNKADIKKQVYQSNRFTNTIESHSFNKKEKQNQLKEKIKKNKNRN
jgi:hypothetical protein